MTRLTTDEIREAFKLLSSAERQRLLDEPIQDEETEPPEDVAALNRALDQADRGELIEHNDVLNYLDARSKERQRDGTGH